MTTLRGPSQGQQFDHSRNPAGARGAGGRTVSAPNAPGDVSEGGVEKQSSNYHNDAEILARIGRLKPELEALVAHMQAAPTNALWQKAGEEFREFHDLVGRLDLVWAAFAWSAIKGGAKHEYGQRNVTQYLQNNFGITYREASRWVKLAHMNYSQTPTPTARAEDKQPRGRNKTKDTRTPEQREQDRLRQQRRRARQAESHAVLKRYEWIDHYVRLMVPRPGLDVEKLKDEWEHATQDLPEDACRRYYARQVEEINGRAELKPEDMADVRGCTIRKADDLVGYDIRIKAAPSDVATLREAIKVFAPSTKDSPHTKRYRDLDGLVAAVTAGLNNSSPDASRARPSAKLVVCATLPELLGGDPHQKVATSEGTLIELGKAVELANGGWLHLAIMDNITGKGIAYGRLKEKVKHDRTASDSQRVLLFADQACCAMPECDEPLSATEAHHIKAWKNSKDTSIKNLTLVCPKHHTMVDDDRIDPYGYYFEIHRDGAVYFHSQGKQPVKNESLLAQMAVGYRIRKAHADWLAEQKQEQVEGRHAVEAEVVDEGA